MKIEIFDIIHGDKIILYYIISQIKSSKTFVVQLDKLTDLINNAQIMVFVRYQ